MTNDTITYLEQFKAALTEWKTTRSSARRTELRTFINQNSVEARRAVAEAGCFRTVTITPPPAVGGLIMREVDPFANVFDPPYQMNLTRVVIDQVDRAIGVYQAGGPELDEATPTIVEGIREDHAFVAMPMDPNDPALEDVLDAIKEAARRCGIHAERVDEPESNERITDRILQSIRIAQYVIVDLTQSKPNVFYEAGYAQGIGKTPIFLAREGTKLEFDLADYPVIFFKNLKELKDRLEQRLRGLAESKAKLRTT